MISKQNVNEITGIRGYNHFIDDYLFENEPIEVSMWNPLHFAVYHGHLPLVKFFFEELKTHILLSFAKPAFENEQAELME